MNSMLLYNVYGERRNPGQSYECVVSVECPDGFRAKGSAKYLILLESGLFDLEEHTFFQLLDSISPYPV